MKKSLSFLLIIIVLAVLIIFVVPKKNTDITDNTNTQDSYLFKQDGLPAAVEAKRQAIYAAARVHDYETLATLTTTNNFRYTFGDGHEGGFVGWLSYIDREQPTQAANLTIPELLKLPYAYLSDVDIYVWPSYFPKSVEQWTEEDVGLMKLTMTDAEIQGYREAGGYLGYRIGIRSDGTWIYYLAGD